VPSGSSFTRLPERAGRTLTFDFEGEPVSAREGDSVTAALLAAGHAVTRTTPVLGSPRGAFCMMGVCFECLLEIDGQPNRQGCTVLAADGLVVRRMRGARAIAADMEPAAAPVADDA